MIDGIPAPGPSIFTILGHYWYKSYRMIWTSKVSSNFVRKADLAIHERCYGTGPGWAAVGMQQDISLVMVTFIYTYIYIYLHIYIYNLMIIVWWTMFFFSDDWRFFWPLMNYDWLYSPQRDSRLPWGFKHHFDRICWQALDVSAKSANWRHCFVSKMGLNQQSGPDSLWPPPMSRLYVLTSYLHIDLYRYRITI